MAEDKETPKDKPDNFFERDIDPEVASRVDKIMNEEPVDQTSESAAEKTVEAAASEPAEGAPLLPSDKLPETLKETDKKPEKPAEPAKDLPADEEPGEARFDHDQVDMESPDTEKAVDDIVKEEADRMLAIEDAKAELLSEGSAEIDEGSLFTRIRLALANLWSYGIVKIAVLLVVLSAVAAIAIYPDSRYFILNKFGVRATSSMTIRDEKTKQPLKDVEVTLAEQTVKTDKEGYAQFSDIKLGSTDLSIRKPAFAPVSQEVTIGWGSNQLGEVDLAAVGSRYTFELVDFLSGQPIANAEAISGSASAVPNEQGILALVVENEDGRDVEIEILAENYRSEKIKKSVGDNDKQKIAMVPVRKHAFISKRDGTYDLFTVDADGKNLKKILPGTGSEREDNLFILNHQNKDVVALVSTRGNVYSADGNLLSVLTIVNLANGENTKVAESESIQLIDFVGDHLVYAREVKDARDEDPARYQLVSFDVENSDEKILAQANYFNDTMVAGGGVYYSPAAFENKKKSGFFKINPDGTGKQTILGEEAWNFFRASYDKLHVAFSKAWYEYDLNSAQLNQLDGAPANNKSRIYVASPDGQKNLWVDERDGKGVLLINDPGGKDKILQNAGGLRNPVRWLDSDHVVYRISTSSETADYVISLSGGEAKKIQDVTDTIGLDRFYYY